MLLIMVLQMVSAIALSHMLLHTPTIETLQVDSDADLISWQEDDKGSNETTTYAQHFYKPFRPNNPGLQYSSAAFGMPCNHSTTIVTQPPDNLC